jgi:alkylation response protein AidB-like acyl-CoA dehydrogenase
LIVAGTRVDERESRRVAEAAREREWRQPSFAKELFLGNVRVDLVHPHPRPSPEDEERGRDFLSKLATFLSLEVDAARIERDAKVPDDVVKGLAELGTFGMKISTEYGGLGLSYLDYGRAMQLLGSVNQALVALVSAHQSIGVPQPLQLFGSEAQKREYLPRCAAGEISAFLLTEPDVGSDPARLAMSAEPTDDGEAYVLNGTKLWTTNGPVAGLLVVMARVPQREGHKGGITAFVVEADTPGIEVVRRNAFMGLRGIENGVTEFRNARVPARNLIGKEGMGLKIALTTLNAGRLSIPAACAASAKWCLKISREWANTRVQWGQPIGKHEAVAQKLAWMAGVTFALESIVELSAAMADAETHDIRIEAAIAKLYASEMAWKIADEAVQIRGGRGFETAESLQARGEEPIPVEQVLRDLRINRIFEGSSEIMRLLIAREAVDTHLSVAGDIIEPDVALADKAKTAARAAGFYARWLPGLAAGRGTLPATYAEFGDLAPHLRYVERASRRLARNIFYGMSRWQGRLERKQAFLGRAVDIGAELYAMSATCVRAQMLIEDDLVDGASAVDLADLFCRGARRRVDTLFRAMWRNDDEADYAAAQRILEGAHAWVETGILDPYPARSGDLSIDNEAVTATV